MCSFNLWIAKLQYVSDISNPIPFLFVKYDAINVVPLPVNGSNTVSVSYVNSLIHLSGKSIGNGAG